MYMHTHMHACMHMCTFLPNMLNIPHSERLWKQQKHICKLLDNLPHEKLSLMILSRYLFPAAVLFLSVPFWWSFYNNRLFMAPHLVRAQSAYKDASMHSFHHTHTHTHTHAPHISTRQDEVHPGEARFLQRQQTGQFLKILASCRHWPRPSCHNIDKFEICINDDLKTNQ